MERILSRVENITEIADEECRPVTQKSFNLNIIDNLTEKYCKKCNSLKPPYTHHCSVCRRCVARMDHHCPWVNNCVGHSNLKFFTLFTWYTFLGSSHALILLGFKGMECKDKRCYIFEDLTLLIPTIVAAFLAFLFSLFTIAMTLTIIVNITSGESTIYQMQKPEA